jgi:hypothetical protein
MKIITRSFKMNGDLDDNYTLFENGEVLHEYDKHKYPGGYNLEETLKASELKQNVKERLLNATSEENRELVKKLLEIE